MANEVFFTKEFYDEKTIFMAVNAYANIAKIIVKEKKSYFKCAVIRSKYDKQVVLNEFSNYVLGLMNR